MTPEFAELMPSDISSFAELFRPGILLKADHDQKVDIGYRFRAHFRSCAANRKR